MEAQPNSQTQTAGTPIDVWYLDQDHAVEEMRKTLERNKRRRRSLDQDELEKRIAERLKDRYADFAEALAVARAIFRLTASDNPAYGRLLICGEMPQKWNARYQARYPGKDLD